MPEIYGCPAYQFLQFTVKTQESSQRWNEGIVNLNYTLALEHVCQPANWTIIVLELDCSIDMR